MIRFSLCLLLIIASTLLAVPVQGPEGSRVSPISSVLQLLAAPSSSDPNGTLAAFNVSLARFDLYTNTTANLSPTTPDPGASLTWYSRINNTETGAAVPGTAFKITVDNNTLITPQLISWNLTVPPPLQGGTTFVKFRWNGTVESGTSARYLLFNGSDTTPFVNVTMAGPRTFEGGSYLNASTIIPLTCASIDECIIVSPTYVGLNLILSFVFKSNSTGRGASVQVENIMVSTSSPSPVQASSHSMELKPLDPSKVDHTGRITLTYNSTVTYVNRYTNQSQDHTWGQMLLTFFMPVSYNRSDTSIELDGAPIYPTPYPLFTGPCNIAPCTNSSFISLNMTSPLDQGVNRSAIIRTTSLNAVVSLQPLLAGVATNFWNPGDSITVSMRSQPGVNVSASQIIALTDSDGFTQANRTFVNKGGTYLYNLTITSAPLGLWTITGSFLHGYDYGRLTHQIRVENLKTTALSRSGSLGQGSTLMVQGRLAFASNSSVFPGGVNVTAFAIDAGSPPGPVSATGPAASGLYISNITQLNGVFSQNQPLVVFFTVTNPQPSSPFSANVTVEHEWYDGQGGSHGVTITFPLTLGDEPFNISPSYLYRMDVDLTTAGIKLTVKSITTNNKVNRPLSTGMSGVTSTRPHFGSFKLSINSASIGGTASSTSSIRSPTYAYVVADTLTPSSLLDTSLTVSTNSTGHFNTTIRGEKLLGAKRLEVFVLARHPNGITLQAGELTTVSDSSFLTPSAVAPGEVTLRQSVLVTLTVESNSSLPITLTVNLDLSGSNSIEPKGSNTITIQPKSSQTTTFTFTAPGEAGTYLLTFSSPQYGPLLTKTLQVAVLQSNLQILIPAIVGLVAALVIIGFYLIRRQPEKEIEEEVKKRPSAGKPSKPAGSSRNP